MRRAVRSAAVVAVLWLSAAAGAHAATAVRFGDDLSGLACPSASVCVAVGGSDADRFDPLTPHRRPQVRRVSAAPLLEVACPTTDLCSAVQDADHAVSFDPTGAGAVRRVVVAPGSFAFALACPSAAQCTAVGDDGREATYDPATAQPAASAGIDADPSLLDVACPALGECVAVGGVGEAIGFDPANPAAAAAATLGGGRALTGIACPTLIQCTAIGPGELTFDPSSPGQVTRLPGPRGDQLQAIACPATTTCTAVLGLGHDRVRPSFAELTFDPAGPAPGRPVLLAHRLPSLGVASLACPSTTQCTSVFNGEAVTFDPAAPGVIAPTIRVLSVTRRAVTLACHGDSACAGQIGSRRYRVAQGARARFRLPADHGRLTVTVASGVPVLIGR